MNVLAKLERRTGYVFQDIDYLEQALTHRSFGRSNYERLEFLGDGLLGFAVADELFHQFPDINEGELSQLRARLVNKQMLATIARDLELGDCLRLGPGELKSGGFNRDSILEDAFEALIGAIYLDGGIDPARAFIKAMMRPKIVELDPTQILKDPKTSLQELLAQHSIGHPTYTVIDTVGPPHDRSFTVRCSIPDAKIDHEGVGKSVRQAEQAAAAAAKAAFKQRR